MSISTAFSNHAGTWATPEPWWKWVCSTLRCERDEVFDPCPADWHEYEGAVCGVLAAALKPRGIPVYYNHPGTRAPTNTDDWWVTFNRHLILEPGIGAIWCAFNVEQFRRLVPSVWSLNGYLVLPSSRIPFVWCGETYTPDRGQPRIKGQPASSPGNWSAFWSSVMPATPPVPCQIVPTGKYGVSWTSGPYNGLHGQEDTR